MGLIDQCFSTLYSARIQMIQLISSLEVRLSILSTLPHSIPLTCLCSQQRTQLSWLIPNQTSLPHLSLKLPPSLKTSSKNLLRKRIIYECCWIWMEEYVKLWLVFRLVCILITLGMSRCLKCWSISLYFSLPSSRSTRLPNQVRSSLLHHRLSVDWISQTICVDR